MTRAKKSKLKCGSGQFVPLPCVCIQSESFSRLSPHAVKLLMDLLSQYTGFNNGDLAAYWVLMKERGWKSRDTLTKALNELLNGVWIIKTRQGGINKCSLFAITVYNIDPCDDKSGRSKFDAHIKPTTSPPGGWYRDSIKLTRSINTRGTLHDSSSKQMVTR